MSRASAQHPPYVPEGAVRRGRRTLVHACTAGGRGAAALAGLPLEVVEVCLDEFDCQDRHGWFLSWLFGHRRDSF